jgi:hypothetical protein
MASSGRLAVPSSACLTPAPALGAAVAVSGGMPGRMLPSTVRRELRGVLTTLAAAMIMGIAVSGMHYTGIAAMRMYRAGSPEGMVMGGAGGATSASFLLPLIIGISLVSFLLSLTVASAPTEEEIRWDAALRRRSGQAALRRRLIPRQRAQAPCRPPRPAAIPASDPGCAEPSEARRCPLRRHQLRYPRRGREESVAARLVHADESLAS